MQSAGDRGDGLRASTPRFEDFYRERWHDAVRLARSLTRSTAAAEDIAQEVFGRMYLSWGRADEPAAYLRVSLVNTCRSWHRRRELERVRLPMLVSTNPGAGEPDELGDVVQALPSRQRAVVMMRYWGDLSEAEIAEELGCAPGTVKSLASRARERLAVAIAS
jgi:RNA polymerase sigma-70 factor (sigma-E family)